MPPPTSSKCQDVFAIIFLILFWPILLIGVLVPFMLLSILYTCSFLLFIYKCLRCDKELLETNPRQFWQGPVTLFARFFWLLGRVWHGYEMIGLENIPDSGPAILINYHSAMPLDATFILSKILLEKKRRVVTIVDRGNAKFPGYKTFSEAMEQLPGTVDSLVEMLGQGDMILIYPGGIREAGLSDKNYEIVWPERAGFGKVAVGAKPKMIPIIPIFTENCRAVNIELGFLRGLFYKMYLKSKKPVWLPLGWFPVKLITHVGKPIEYDQDSSVEEIVQSTKDGLKTLIDTHQRLPGSVWCAFFDRFSCSK